MKPWKLKKNTPAKIAADWLLENEWTLADVLTWILFNKEGKVGRAFPKIYYGTRVLIAFIRQGGATHERQIKFADQMMYWRHGQLKLTLAKLFSAPPEAGGILIESRTLNSGVKMMLTPDQAITYPALVEKIYEVDDWTGTELVNGHKN
jgi:hypothetical protein